ncbi:hypothetical protein T492DRAFT_855409 [Pavlovales sp. CCMP2436]|nr:hypothetical protein T492DRAFT_855409 [Pavlovales sp. CCMP2436]
MAVDAERTCAHCQRALEPGAEHLALACGGGKLSEAHAMHCSCAWAALSGAGEIQCGVPGCAARHAPSACTFHASSGRRSAALLATKVAGGPSAPASAAFAAPGEQVLVTTHYVGTDGQLQPQAAGRAGRAPAPLCLARDAMASTPADPPTFSLPDLRELALREASGTWRFVFALATGEAEKIATDELRLGLPTLVLNACKTSVNVKDLFSVLRLCNGWRTPLPMRAPTTDEAAFKVQSAYGVGLTPEGAPQADDTPKDFAEVFPTPKAAVVALTPDDDDLVHVGKYVFTYLEDALALKASDDRHLPAGERLMAPEDESADPDEELPSGPPDGLDGGSSDAAPTSAPATALAPASAPAANDGASAPAALGAGAGGASAAAPAGNSVAAGAGQGGRLAHTRVTTFFDQRIGASCMTDGKLRAAKRDELCAKLCAELCRLRWTHPALVAAAAARFAAGEGYTTNLPVLAPGLAGYHGPSVAYNGKTYAPLEYPLMQLCKMRTRAGKEFAIADFERPTGAAADARPAVAGGAGGLTDEQAPTASLPTQPAGKARAHAGEVVARTVGDQLTAARAERLGALAEAELSEAADASQAKRQRGPGI